MKVTVSREIFDEDTLFAGTAIFIQKAGFGVNCIVKDVSPFILNAMYVNSCNEVKIMKVTIDEVEEGSAVIYALVTKE